MSIRRTLVATGGTSGLGFEAIKQLVQNAPPSISYSLFLGARNEQAARRAYASLALNDRHFIFTHPLELSDLSSVKAFAERIRGDLEDTKLDVLLLSAAISKASTSETSRHPAWSEAYRVNCIAHQYLLHLLQDKLDRTRVVVVSSMLYKRVKDTASIAQILSSDSQASALDIYKTTKFVQLVQTARWREELKDRADIVAVSPGFVPETGLSRESGFLANLAMRYVLPWAPFATSLHDGGKAIRRAINDDLDLSAGHLLLDKSGKWEELDPWMSDHRLRDQWWLTKAEIEQHIAFHQWNKSIDEKHSYMMTCFDCLLLVGCYHYINNLRDDQAATMNRGMSRELYRLYRKEQHRLRLFEPASAS